MFLNSYIYHNGGETGIRTLGRLAPTTVFENCVSVFNSSHGRQILKEIWHISVMICHTLSALSEKTSSWPRHSQVLLCHQSRWELEGRMATQACAIAL